VAENGGVGAPGRGQEPPLTPSASLPAAPVKAPVPPQLSRGAGGGLVPGDAWSSEKREVLFFFFFFKKKFLIHKFVLRK